MLLREKIRGLKASFFPVLVLLFLAIGAGCARGTNEPTDLANEFPDLANVSPDLANVSPERADASPEPENESPDFARLEAFLAAHHRRVHHEGQPPVRVPYLTAAIDLNGDGLDERLVYLRSEGFCGSGGCTLLILTPLDRSFRVVTRITIVRLPIRALDTRSNGWRNLSVTAQGGGQIEPLEIELAYDGESYPTNPSVPPARRLKGVASGEILIDTRRWLEADGAFVIGEP